MYPVVQMVGATRQVVAATVVMVVAAAVVVVVVVAAVISVFLQLCRKTQQLCQHQRSYPKPLLSPCLYAHLCIVKKKRHQKTILIHF